MNNSDIGYYIPDFFPEDESKRKKRILADGLLSKNETFKSAQKTLQPEKKKTGIVERNDSKLLTNDGRELLNS